MRQDAASIMRARPQVPRGGVENDRIAARDCLPHWTAE